jgi:hypothetical protein
MSIGKLIEFFSTFRVLPVEVEIVAEQIVESYKVADDIVFVPVNVDPGDLKGIHYRYFCRDKDEKIISRILIVFSERLALDEQRIVCCKELIHVMDEHFIQTDTADKVLSLADALLGPPPKQATGLSDLAAISDRLAIYQALSILIPEEMREELLEQHRSGVVSSRQIAHEFVIPEEYVDMVMRPNWSKVWLKFRQL